MRKLFALLTAGAIVASLSSTALAAKPQKIHETFGASLAPWPKLAQWGDEVGMTKPGCTSGQEGINWVAQEFTAPGKGTLHVYMEGFVGDHDVYIFKDDVPLIRGENAQVPVGNADIAPPEEDISYTMTKGETVTMVACNWLGQPDVLAHYEGTFK
jgi:hypothetical protein